MVNYCKKHLFSYLKPDGEALLQYIFSYSQTYGEALHEP